jgi:hypothetical protein
MRPAARVARRTLLAVLPLAACSTWRVRPTPAAEAAPGASLVRVTLVGGRPVVLARARVAGDSLVGEEGTPPQRRAVALREVVRVEGREFSPARTLGVGWLALNAVAGVLLLVYLAG